MAVDVNAREHRLRKQAELQSSYVNLTSLRDREATYIAASAAIPELLINQIKEQRQTISRLEDDLSTLAEELPTVTGREWYRQGFTAELSGDLAQAQKFYKKATRSAYPDAEAALRSARYQSRLAKNKPAGRAVWTPQTAGQSRNRQLWGAALAGVFLLMAILMAVNGKGLSSQGAAIKITATFTPTPPAVVLIIPDTATPEPTLPPPPTSTLTSTPVPARTPTPTLPPDTPTPTPRPTLRAAPQVLEPKNGLVWIDGAIVFEFKEQNLAYDELYCVNTLRGYDQTLTENWSYPPVGGKKTAIPIESGVFRIARLQGIKCVVWSAAIGKDSCDNIISETTEERIIGLPQPCQFK